MAEAAVEGMIGRICEAQSSSGLFEILQTELDIDVIMNGERDATTAAVYGSEYQIMCMRRMFLCLQEAEWTVNSVYDVDAAVVAAERGPPFFNLIRIMWKHWSEKWNAEQEEDAGGDDGGDDEGSSDDDDEDMGGGGEDMGGGQAAPHHMVRPMSAGADMGDLLRRLGGLTR